MHPNTHQLRLRPNAWWSSVHVRIRRCQPTGTLRLAEGVAAIGGKGTLLQNRVTGVTLVTKNPNSMNLKDLSCVTRSYWAVESQCYMIDRCYTQACLSQGHAGHEGLRVNRADAGSN